MDKYAALAVKNIASHGDTDIFPLSIENALFYDNPKKIIDLLPTMEKEFEDWLSKYPVDTIRTCIPLGHTGFRWATLIDPLWNAFLLYQVLKAASLIEKFRLPKSKGAVFSYRFLPQHSSGTLFDKEMNWRKYYQTSIETAESNDYTYVVRFDISDFYNRIYHHRLEQALVRAGVDGNLVKRIMKILQDISNNASYGLPIGGNAARILAETVLNAMDQLMTSRRIRYCRFVDDFILFASSKEDAFRKLNWCADFLLRNEGLSLSKSKTQVQSCSEFLAHARATIEGEDAANLKEKAEFLQIHIHYDPYSPTADEDYRLLVKKLDKFDIISLLKSEIKKSQIHQALGKQLLNAVKYLKGQKLNLALIVICSNFDALYPVLPTVLKVICKKLPEAENSTRATIGNLICDLVAKDSYLLQTDNNAAYTVRLLSFINSEESIQSVEALYQRSTSPLVRANCINAMTNLKNQYWLSDVKSKFSTLSKWERRAFIVASFYLGDEGKHWRNYTSEQFTVLEKCLKEWLASKQPQTSGWKLPL
jgi:hypothetical protein